MYPIGFPTLFVSSHSNSFASLCRLLVLFHFVQFLFWFFTRLFVFKFFLGNLTHSIWCIQWSKLRTDLLLTSTLNDSDFCDDRVDTLVV